MYIFLCFLWQFHYNTTKQKSQSLCIEIVIFFHGEGETLLVFCRACDVIVYKCSAKSFGHRECHFFAYKRTLCESVCRIRTLLCSHGRSVRICPTACAFNAASRLPCKANENRNSPHEVDCFYFYGEGETRTPAPVSRPTPLAGAPRHQLEYFSIWYRAVLCGREVL